MMITWAPIMATMTTIASLPYTSAMAAANEADLHVNGKGGVRGGTNNYNKQQLRQERRVQEEEAPSESPSESPEGTEEEVEYSPIYNTRMKTCPGYETEGLKGYKTLDDLRHDLQLYFYDMNGYNYHRTAADIAADLAADARTESPTGYPSASPSISYQPTRTSSNVPSSFPTQQPVTAAPTDEPTSSVRLPQEPTKSPSPTMLPKFAGSSSPGSFFGTDLDDAVDGTFAPTGPVPSLRTASPSRTPTSKPIEFDQNTGVGRIGRNRMREHSNGDVVDSDRRRLQEETTTDATETFDEEMSAYGPAELDEIPTETGTTEVGGINFHICPNTNFQFNSILVAQLKFLPLIVESPVQNPVTIACLEEHTCTFTGGDYHMVFNNNGLGEDSWYISSLEVDQEHNPITISGINFEESEEASIVMNDPRGKVIFEKCKWENNEGEAIVVDGKYTGKNLEREYYGVDDFMLPPGKVNPFASTEPTMPAETTPFSFFTTTVRSITTEYSAVKTTNAPDSERLLEALSVAGTKSLIYIRKSIFTGNKGKATIVVDSFSEDEGLDSGSSSTGSIHLQLEKSEFSFERVATSVIVTSGAKVSSTGNVFEKNTGSSMIQTNSGIISITDTKFSNNVVTGGDGVVVVDSDSKVGDTNCVIGTTDSEDDGLPTAALVSSDLCEGAVVMTEGICQPFGQVCDPDATPTFLSARGVSRESDIIEVGIAAASGSGAQSGSSVEVAKADRLELFTSKSSKSAKSAKQQQVSSSRGRGEKKKKKGKSSKPKRRRQRKWKRKSKGGKRKLDETVIVI